MRNETISRHRSTLGVKREGGKEGETNELGVQFAPKVNLERQTGPFPPYVRQRPTSVLVVQIPSEIRTDSVKRLEEEETV